MLIVCYTEALDGGKEPCNSVVEGCKVLKNKLQTWMKEKDHVCIHSILHLSVVSHVSKVTLTSDDKALNDDLSDTSMQATL